MTTDVKKKRSVKVDYSKNTREQIEELEILKKFKERDTISQNFDNNLYYNRNSNDETFLLRRLTVEHQSYSSDVFESGVSRSIKTYYLQNISTGSVSVFMDGPDQNDFEVEFTKIEMPNSMQFFKD
jgi:hypothetical protein